MNPDRNDDDTSDAMAPPALTIRDVLLAFANDYPNILDRPSAVEPSRAWISREARQPFRSVLPGPQRDERFAVKISGGQGRREGRVAEVPWAGIRRRDLTSSFQDGVYIVYLISPDRAHVVLALILGVTRPPGAENRRAPRSSEMQILRDRAASLRRSLELPLRFTGSTDFVAGSTDRSKQYAAGIVSCIEYAVDDLPSEEVLRSDLMTLLDHYALIGRDYRITRVGIHRWTPSRIDPDRHRRIGEWRPPADSEAARQLQERRSSAHEDLIQALRATVVAACLPPPEDNPHIDMIVNGLWLIEAKTLRNDEVKRGREALAQLLHYQFIYKDDFPGARLMAVLDHEPRGDGAYVPEFLGHHGIYVAWRVDDGFHGTPQTINAAPWLRGARSLAPARARHRASSIE